MIAYFPLQRMGIVLFLILFMVLIIPPLQSNEISDDEIISAYKTDDFSQLVEFDLQIRKKLFLADGLIEHVKASQNSAYFLGLSLALPPDDKRVLNLMKEACDIEPRYYTLISYIDRLLRNFSLFGHFYKDFNPAYRKNLQKDHNPELLSDIIDAIMTLENFEGAHKNALTYYLISIRLLLLEADVETISETIEMGNKEKFDSSYFNCQQNAVYETSLFLGNSQLISLWLKTSIGINSGIETALSQMTGLLIMRNLDYYNLNVLFGMGYQYAGAFCNLNLPDSVTGRKLMSWPMEELHKKNTQREMQRYKNLLEKYNEIETRCKSSEKHKSMEYGILEPLYVRKIIDCNLLTVDSLIEILSTESLSEYREVLEKYYNKCKTSPD